MKKKPTLHFHISLAICIGLLITMLYSAYASDTEQTIADSVIRLHVIANSDTEADQNLKLMVRDAILHNGRDIFTADGNVADAEALLLSRMDDITRIAQTIINEQGADYTVTVSYGRSDFPTRTYGGITLPAGTYNALKVVIGEGRGRNWWCVMFPPLCLVDGTTARIPDTSKAILKDTLPPEEYDMITRSDDMQVEVRFKVYELWQSSKLKIKNMIASAK